MEIIYKGDSNGVLAYNFLKQIMARARKTIDTDVAAELMQKQQNRFGACGDLLRRFETHHKKPFSQGGTDNIDNIIPLCPPCHAHETERQEQASFSHNVYLESHLSPRMYKHFVDLPIPRQLHWGDSERQVFANMHDFDNVQCLDIVGCRSNFSWNASDQYPSVVPWTNYSQCSIKMGIGYIKQLSMNGSG